MFNDQSQHKACMARLEATPELGARSSVILLLEHRAIAISKFDFEHRDLELFFRSVIFVFFDQSRNEDIVKIGMLHWIDKGVYMIRSRIQKTWKRCGIILLFSKEWSKSVEKQGKLRFSHDAEKRPYLSRVELRAIAEIILSEHFSTRGVKPTVLCAVAEIVSMRFVNGVGPHPGIVGIDYPTACWLYKDLGYKAYIVESVDNLTKPFVSLYFGATYLAWLSQYEGSKERTPQFVVRAYLAGPKNMLTACPPCVSRDGSERIEGHRK
ncbi:hypothetical protein HYC85_012308 [Camellia sinensis]|uniref:Uncharacterized protein n=1 Tax=Camellia sinensis TaxID=4442 RepID=A0A7J7HCI4_CAMSI|nr:hypothetical protein HYC85_012308 [Camellia sinensis]